MTRFENKMKVAEDRYTEKKQERIDKQLSRSNYVSMKLEKHSHSLRLRWQDTFTRDVNKLVSLKKKNEAREKMLNETSETLQDRHRAKMDKLQRLQEDEKREFKERIVGLS